MLRFALEVFSSSSFIASLKGISLDKYCLSIWGSKIISIKRLNGQEMFPQSCKPTISLTSVTCSLSQLNSGLNRSVNKCKWPNHIYWIVILLWMRRQLHLTLSSTGKDHRQGLSFLSFNAPPVIFWNGRCVGERSCDIRIKCSSAWGICVFQWHGERHH